jgi:hypothetical protein
LLVLLDPSHRLLGAGRWCILPKPGAISSRRECDRFLRLSTDLPRPGPFLYPRTWVETTHERFIEMLG